MKDKGRLPPFVPLLKETLASPAWRALSHGARSLYVCLKARYSSNLHNNGRIWVSQRMARNEIRSGTNEIARWFRELEHYGFIVQTKGGSLGLNGKGTAPHWRLTECGHMRDPPTRDFMKWDGTRFRDSKIESRNGNHRRPVMGFRYITASRKSITPMGTSVMENRDMVGNEVSRDSVTYLVNHSVPPGNPEGGSDDR
jgi:hypothetical protein